VAENWLRGNSPKNEPEDYRLPENFDRQTGFKQPKTRDPGIGPQKRDESGRFCRDYHVVAQDQ
jgi:hypothetical protein